MFKQALLLPLPTTLLCTYMLLPDYCTAQAEKRSRKGASSIIDTPPQSECPSGGWQLGTQAGGIPSHEITRPEKPHHAFWSRLRDHPGFIQTTDAVLHNCLELVASLIVGRLQTCLCTCSAWANAGWPSRIRSDIAQLMESLVRSGQPHISTGYGIPSWPALSPV